MNKVILKGRLIKDVEVRTANSGTQISSFSIAVNRKFKKEGQPEADFFNCIAFAKTGEFVSTYFSKGQEILLEGSIQNRSWEDSSGTKRYSTDIIVDSVEFCGSKLNSNGESKPSVSTNNAPNFDSFPDPIDDDDLPF